MNGKRSRSGCLTCRRRHHKCDESKPTCLNCRLRGAKCEGYSITLSDFTVRDGFNGQMVARAVRGSPRERSRKRLRTVSEESNHSGDSPDAGQSKDDSGLSDSQRVQEEWQIDPITTTNSSPMALPEGMNIIPVDGSWWNSPARSRAATPSVLMDLPVVPDLESLDWTLPDLVADDNIDETRDAPTTSTGIEEGLLQLMDKPVLWSTPDDPFDQYLFSHYMDNLSLRLYPVKPDQNPYRVVYGTLAAQSQPLLKTILFASAFHLSNLGRLPKFALQPYRDAMRKAFRDAVVSEDQLVGVGATVLLSIVFDVIGSGLESWSSKLNGCRQLFKKALARSSSPIDAELQCMIVQYNWAAIMSRTLLRGQTGSEELECIDVADNTDTPENIDAAYHQSHWWQNLPDHRMHLLLREATDLSLAVDRVKTAPESSVDDLLQLMPQAGELLDKINHWHPDTSQVDPEMKWRDIIKESGSELNILL
ncbi:hypothetical protein MW887_001878 [Aspergillus wentii]|nr:hypothetical protein MW887_001878 [Aspergillus wentii]